MATGSPANRTVLVPAEVVTFNDGLRRMVVSRPRVVIETGPSLGYDEEVTSELERRVRLHYGLEIAQVPEDTVGHGSPIAGVPGIAEVTGSERAPSLSDQEEDEVRVRRSEEEIRVEAREREAGTMRVRKRVRTERERIEVPKKRTEVTVERVPVEEAASSREEIAGTPEFVDEEIVVPIVEEEIVVEKRPVVKEEIRIRKQVRGGRSVRTSARRRSRSTTRPIATGICKGRFTGAGGSRTAPP